MQVYNLKICLSQKTVEKIKFFDQPKNWNVGLWDYGTMMSETFTYLIVSRELHKSIFWKTL